MLSLIALLAVVRGAWAAFWWEPERPCVDPVKFTPPDKQRVNCQCHGPGEEPVTSLFNSDDDKVFESFLIPNKPKPYELKILKDLEYWELNSRTVLKNQTSNASKNDGCPFGFKRWTELRPPRDGLYLEKVPSEALSLLGVENSDQYEHCGAARACPYGYYCYHDDFETWNEPKACGKGKLCNEMNLSEPLPCPMGFYCVTPRIKQQCVLGFHCPEGTHTPKLCPKGYYCGTPCNQTECPEGNWCPEGSHLPIACPWWSKCAEGTADKDWWAVGLTMAIGVPIVFELALGLAFRLQVHEQTAMSLPRGMTRPCALLMLSSLVLAWAVMPSVAVIKTVVFVYAMTGLSNAKKLGAIRVLLLSSFACLVYILLGYYAATWTLYIPCCVFVGFLSNSPLLVNRRRGLMALRALALSLAFVDGELLAISVDGHFYYEAAFSLVHGLMFIPLLAYLSCSEIQRPLLPSSEGLERMPGISFRLENVGLTVGTSRKAVLEDISLKIDGDSSCALMGPSGSGKSSLLNVLTGRALLYGEVSGRLFANGELIPEGIEAKCKNATGFVPQDDVMHTDLTVYENVYFSARLRLPPDTEAQDVVDTVEQVLKDVGIWHVKDTPVGNADLRGISGGQRKRASIAMELVGRPSVLFLDEPTSGLDASAAHSIITLICDKSQLRCTSIAVIHQPRWKTLACFDQVVLLATGGYLVYSGPVPDSVAYFTQSLRMKVSEGDNPADLFLDFIGGEAMRSPEDLAREWVSYQPVVMESSNPQIELSGYEKSRPGVSQTFWILYLRCSLQVCRLRSVRLTNLFLLAFFLLLLRVLLGEGGSFADVVMRLGIGQSMLMLPVCIHGLHIFNSDRLERQREDIAGIPTLSQYFAKDFCHLVELMLFAAVWTGVYGPYSQLGISPWLMLRVAVAQAYLAFGISNLLSVNMPSQSTATVTLMLFLVVAQLCSGVDMISYKDMRHALLGGGWLIFILSPSFYTVQRFLPIMINQTITSPVRDAVCNGFLREKGVVCERPDGPRGPLHSDMSHSDSPYIFLSSDTQLVMLGLAVRAIALLQLQLRTVTASASELALRRLVLFLAAAFFLLTIPATYNYEPLF